MQLHQQYQRLQAEHVTALVQALDAIRVVQVCVSGNKSATECTEYMHTHCKGSCRRVAAYAAEQRVFVRTEHVKCTVMVA